VHDTSEDPSADPEDLSDAPILVCNHSSYIDGPVILGKTGRPKVFAISIVRHLPILFDIVSDMGIILIDRANQSSREASMQAMKDHV